MDFRVRRRRKGEEGGIKKKWRRVFVVYLAGYFGGMSDM